MDLPRPGETFEGRYRILAVLGEGGFATVFSGLDSAGSRVAIKILKPGPQGYSFDTSSRFTREIQVLATLTDPHTVRLLDYGRSSSGLLYMVFEHVPGRDLSEVLAEYGTLPVATAIDILRQVLCSLREAHAAGLLHRDIKPGNIRLFEDGPDRWRVKLLDFGIARSADGPQQSRLTQDGELIGTPRYMSPEQLTERQLTAASDLYALGLVGIEMLEGTRALPANRWADQLERLQPGYVFGLQDPRGERSAINPWLQRMTAVDPAHRFATAEDALRALTSLAASAPRRRVAGPAPHLVETTSPPAARPSRRAMALLAVLAGAAALSLAALVWVLSTRPAPAPTVIVRTHRALPAAPAPNKAPPPTPHVADVGPDLVAPDLAAQVDAGTPRSAGCGEPGPPFEGPGMLSPGFGLSRGWVGYVPKGYDPQRPYPLVVIFHQLLQKPREILDQSRFGPVADREGFLLIAPEDPALFEHWGDEKLATRIRDLVEMTAELACVDRNRIYLVGHGSGGHAAERLACEPWVAGAAWVSYRTHKLELGCAGKATPTIYLGTTRGTRMPLEGGDACAGTYKISLADNEKLWRDRNQCSGERRVWATEDEGTCYTWNCETPFVSCRLEGGHGWPGPPTDEADPTRCDPVQADFPAAETIWRFFDGQTR